jgi:hypothetical protein
MENASPVAPQGRRLIHARRLAALALSALALASTACVSAPPQDDSRVAWRGQYRALAPEGTVLWVVRFFNEVNPGAQPSNLALTVEDAARTQGGQFVFKPLYSVAGQWVEFVVRLDLPAGEYRVSRLFGVAGSGQMAPQFDFSTDQRFTVDTARTTYLGRIEIVNRPREGEAGVSTGSSFGGAATAQAGFSAGSPVLGVFDKSSLDLPSLRARFADLRDRRIDNGLSQRAPLQEAKAATMPLSAMPMHIRRAFDDFAASPLPRAFALDPAGSAHGMASGGEDAAARALRECEQRRRRGASADGGSACELYALDDTSSPPSAPPAPTRSPGQAGSR